VLLALLRAMRASRAGEGPADLVFPPSMTPNAETKAKRPGSTRIARWSLSSAKGGWCLL
jgi:hypothetical protein